MNHLRVKRAYRAARQSDGQRILVDRIWPRGVAKDRLRITAWEKDLAPSDGLRKWFGHDPEMWDEFRRRYARELDDKPEEISRLRRCLDAGPVTLVYGAKETRFNNAVALKEYLERRERQG